MSEHDETLRRALEENAQLRSEREQSLRAASSAEFSGRLRFAERVYWGYAIVCVALGVMAIKAFVHCDDTKTLIGCAVLMLVIYETTVLMKLWFATAGMKMSVLKDVKLLRLEVAGLATAVGVKQPNVPTTKYEPMRGASWFERKLWLVACMIVAIAASSWSSHQLESGGGEVSANSLVTLATDGSATSVTEIVQIYDSQSAPKTFLYHAPKDWSLRFIDPEGQEMPVETTEAGTHKQYEVALSHAARANGKIQYTRIEEVANAAASQDGVWSYKNDIAYGGQKNRFSITVCLPSGASLDTATPRPHIEFEQDGRTALRFQASRGMNDKFTHTIRYELLEE